MSETYKSFSRQLSHPVTLVSVSDGQHQNIATMAWVSPVSFNPPLVMVSISPKRFTHNLLLKADEFAILVLSDSQKELSTLAGTKSGRKIDKWELEPFRKLRKDPEIIRAPLLQGCRAAYECRLWNHYPAGDHTIFVGEVLRAEVNEEVDPLLLFNRRYYKIGDAIARYP